MAEFACRPISLRDILECSFALSKTDYRMFLFLVGEREALTVQQIGHRIGLERSTVQKAISRLVDKGLAARMQENLTDGGYLFRYRIKDKQRIKEQLLALVRSWHASVARDIERW